MQYFVYILLSSATSKSYVGYTNNLDRRLFQHNNATKNSYTSNFRPWVLIHSESFENKKDAIKREKFFKSGIGRELKQSIITEYFENN